ncbi:superoxide dismutase family protein [Aliivibrio logei]|uniref:superoxide dismutase family protein n=1 Tax=Aliivibrio logei TaxID=688 RepID=UPI0003A5D3D7|nr:superoxide dismutase family protein [Aliivibrio logei]
MKKHNFFAVFCLISTSSMAHSTIVNMIELDDNQSIGVISITENEYGTVFTPNLSTLPSGLHGFHIHTNPSCDSTVVNNKIILGGAAGGHYDPQNTGKHGFPWSNDNHLGDLPALYVDHNGMASQPVLAPRIKLDDLKGRAIMIHAGADNHSDHPAKLGGGGTRMMCGVIK